MEVSALKYQGGLGLHARTPLLRLQSDERLIALIRRGNSAAFEALVSRYEVRLLAFCRHLLGSREDAEDILQEVLAAAFNAILADDRPIKVRPWLYRIARNRSLNHLRRNQTIGVDSMDVHLSDNGASAADKVHSREEFRLLLGDIRGLPETQRTALVLREMDALSYEQIAETMDTTVPSVKSLLVRARVSLAEAAEARVLSCDQVRLELGEVAEGLKRRPSPPVRRHLRSCERCSTFRLQLRETNKALAALLPFGPLALLKQFALLHIGHSASSGAATSAAGSGATAGGAAAGSSAAGSTAVASSTAVAGSTAAASTTAAAGSAVVAGSGAGGLVSAGIGAVATKAVAGIAAAALVTAGAVEVGGTSRAHGNQAAAASLAAAGVGGAPIASRVSPARVHKAKKAEHKALAAKQSANTTTTPTTTTPAPISPVKAAATKPPDPTATAASATTPRTLVTTITTHCQTPASGGVSVSGSAAPDAGNVCATSGAGSGGGTSTTPACTPPPADSGASTTPTTTTPGSTTTQDPTTTSPATTTDPTTTTSTVSDPTSTNPSCSGATPGA